MSDDVETDDVDTDDVEDDQEEYIPVELVPSTDVSSANQTNTALTVLGRMLRAGICHDRSQAYLIAGAVRVDGVQVTDPDTPAAPPARITLLPA